MLMRIISLVEKLYDSISVSVERVFLMERISEINELVFVFSKAKRRAFYGKWTESFYSYDASLYDDFVTKSSLSHIDQSALGTSSEIHGQESSVSCDIVYRTLTRMIDDYDESSG